MSDSDLKSLAAQRDWTRRNFVTSVLASGFAVATQPISAQTITTDARGLTAGEVKVPVDGGLPRYVVLERSPVEKKLPPLS